MKIGKQKKKKDKIPTVHSTTNIPHRIVNWPASCPCQGGITKSLRKRKNDVMRQRKANISVIGQTGGGGGGGGESHTLTKNVIK